MSLTANVEPHPIDPRRLEPLITQITRTGNEDHTDHTDRSDAIEQPRYLAASRRMGFVSLPLTQIS